MDVMMPRCSGILATMRIREKSNVPILILSAKAEGSDRVLGLEAGADDYLVKPFYKQELLARVKALLRRYDDLGSIRETGGDGRIREKLELNPRKPEYLKVVWGIGYVFEAP